MSKTSPNSSQALNALGLILCLGALPLLVGVTGCASNRTAQNATERQAAAQRKDDHAISCRVGAALADDGQYMYLEDVKVRTFKGVVELSGCVNTSTLKDRAGDIAKRVACVRDVHDGIAVRD
jgi:osmotically-inducible protein OsmY